MDSAYQPAGWCRCGYRVDPGVCPECGRDNVRPLKRDPRLRRRAWLRRAGLLLVGLALLGGGWLARDELALRFVPLGVLHAVAFGDDGIDPRWEGGLRGWAYSVIVERSARLAAVEHPVIERELKRLAEMARSQPVEPWCGSFLPCWSYSSPQLHVALGGEFVYSGPRLRGFGSSGGSTGCFLGIGSLISNNGRAVIESGRSLLFPRFDPRLPDFACPVEYVQVRWRGARLLIERRAMSSFCSFVNGGHVDWALDEALIRAGDRFSHDAALPDVPAEFAAMILNEPVSLRLDAILDESAYEHLCEYTARFDRGRRDGIFVGSQLFFDTPEGEPSAFRQTFCATEVTDDACIATLRLFRDEHMQEAFEPPQVGGLYSTRDPQIVQADEARILDELVDRVGRDSADESETEDEIDVDPDAASE